MKNFSLTNSLSEVLADTHFGWIEETMTSTLLTYETAESGPVFKSSSLSKYQVKDEQRVSFSPAGIFKDRIEEANLVQYSSVVALTVKGFWHYQLGEHMEQAALSPYTFAVFSGESSEEFHVLVLTDSTKETHEIAFSQVLEHYKREVGLPGRTVMGADLCYAIQMPHCNSVYHNPQCQAFPVKKPVVSPGTLLRADIARLTSKDRDMEELLLSAPALPSEIYDNLPGLLRRGAEAFQSGREKDINLTGNIGILSGCFPYVTGLYDGSEVHANLNCFIVAPAASGKGALAYSKTIALGIHEQWISSGREAPVEAEEMPGSAGIDETATENSGKSSAGKGASEQVLFIPANASSAAVLNHLVLNGGVGIMCETEADTMANSLKQDWGGYSDMIRKAFHHEPISYTRKTDREFAEILSPQLSVVLSGTPSQVPNLIKSAEDGLFSRFLYYTFVSSQGWRDVSPQNGKRNLTEYFDRLKAEVLQVHNRIGRRRYSFELTEGQWELLNRCSEQWHREVSSYMGGDAQSIVIRLGLAQFRIAMLLSILRHDEQRLDGTLITCTDQDFQTAQSLASCYLRHALLIYCSLPKSTPPQGSKNMASLLDKLPKSKAFTRNEAVEVGGRLNIGARTVDKYLRRLVQSGQLEQPLEYGPYKKV